MLEPVKDSLERFDDVGDHAETIAETVEPLHGTAERVGRISERFSRRRG